MDIGLSGWEAVIAYISGRVVNIGLGQRVDQAGIWGEKQVLFIVSQLSYRYLEEQEQHIRQGAQRMGRLLHGRGERRGGQQGRRHLAGGQTGPGPAQWGEQPERRGGGWYTMSVCQGTYTLDHDGCWVGGRLRAPEKLPAPHQTVGLYCALIWWHHSPQQQQPTQRKHSSATAGLATRPVQWWALGSGQGNTMEFWN